MSAIDELVRNAAAARNGGLPRAPARQVAIVTCMDARIDPVALFGLEAGDANVIRNAGGLVTDDVIRTLAISQRLLGTEEVMLVHHTDCGMLDLDDDEFRDRIEEETGVRPDWPAEQFSDLDREVREHRERIRSSPFLPKTENVRSFVYEVETGRLREVV